MNDINELIVAYKLFEREITYDDLLNVEFDNIYLLSKVTLNIQVEYIPIRINKDHTCFLSKQLTSHGFKYIKPNLFATRTITNLLDIVNLKEYKNDYTSNYRTSFAMC